MWLKASILYSWAVKISTFWLPDAPVFMRFRGWLYSFMMRESGRNFQVCSTAYFNSLSGFRVGRDVYIGPNVVVIGREIEIQSEVIVGPGTVISGGNHVYLDGSYRFSESSQSPVRIEFGSWVAGNCTITAGSVLPRQSILAAGAVLTKEMKECGSVYAGVPARLIGQNSAL